MNGTIHNREQFLEGIAVRMGRERKRYIEKPKWKYHPQDDVLKNASKEELVEVLKNQCEKIHTDFVITSKSNLYDSVKKVVDNFNGGPIVVWNDQRFVQYGLSTVLGNAPFIVDTHLHVWNYREGAENIRQADKANIGITISDITLAESGTAVLFSSEDKGRTVSFLPAKSIIIVPKSTIVPRMTQAARMIRERLKNNEHLPSCINFITGPSNSADIEMVLVVGVHGPTKAAYIVVEDI